MTDQRMLYWGRQGMEIGKDINSRLLAGGQEDPTTRGNGFNSSTSVMGLCRNPESFSEMKASLRREKVEPLPSNYGPCINTAKSQKNCSLSFVAFDHRVQRQQELYKGCATTKGASCQPWCREKGMAENVSRPLSIPGMTGLLDYCWPLHQSWGNE